MIDVVEHRNDSLRLDDERKAKQVSDLITMYTMDLVKAFRIDGHVMLHAFAICYGATLAAVPRHEHERLHKVAREVEIEDRKRHKRRASA